MKTVYLIRHAKSYWGDQRLSDFDRPLNKRGKRDAPFMGEILFDKKVRPELIISSPAKRAHKTATLIAKKIRFAENKILLNESLYEASSNDILKVIRSLDDNISNVMIFGHNPGLTLLNNYISDNYIDNIPTCGIVTLQSEMKWNEFGKNTCRQLFFEYPKLYITGNLC